MDANSLSVSRSTNPSGNPCEKALAEVKSWGLVLPSSLTMNSPGTGVPEGGFNTGPCAISAEPTREAQRAKENVQRNMR